MSVSYKIVRGQVSDLGRVNAFMDLHFKPHEPLCVSLDTSKDHTCSDACVLPNFPLFSLTEGYSLLAIATTGADVTELSRDISALKVADRGNETVALSSGNGTGTTLLTPGSESTTLVTPRSEEPSTVLTPGSEEPSTVVTSGSESTTLVTPGSEEPSTAVTPGSECSTLVTPGSKEQFTAVTPGSDDTTLVTPGSEEPNTVATPGSTENGTLVGLCLTGVSTPDEDHPEAECADMMKMFHLFSRIEREGDVWTLTGADKSFDVHVLCVDSAYRRQGIARALLEETVEMARTAMFPVMNIVCTSTYTACLMDTMPGWRNVVNLRYDEHRDEEGRQVFVPPPPHEVIRTYVKIFER